MIVYTKKTLTENMELNSAQLSAQAFSDYFLPNFLPNSAQNESLKANCLQERILTFLPTWAESWAQTRFSFLPKFFHLKGRKSWAESGETNRRICKSQNAESGDDRDALQSKPLCLSAVRRKADCV